MWSELSIQARVPNRRGKWRGRNGRRQRHGGPVGWYTEAGHRDPLKRRAGRGRLRGGPSWRSLHGSRERPAVATMVANQASDTARILGSDAANLRDTSRFSRQPAKTHSLTGTTCNALKPNCSWAGTDNDPGGIATACWLGENFGSPQRIETGSECVSRRDSRGCHLSSEMQSPQKQC